MHRTYQEMFTQQDFSHLARTVEQYLSTDTPLWWVDAENLQASAAPVACLWVGYAIDQVTGSRRPHIFLLYVHPEHRRKGIGTALMQFVENWAQQRGDRQISLQVFTTNTPAINLYQQLGYRTESLLMLKSLDIEK